MLKKIGVKSKETSIDKTIDPIPPLNSTTELVFILDRSGSMARVPLEQIEPITRDDYFVRGCTALIDAIGMTVSHIEEVHRYIRPEDVPARTVFVITTDGLENASKEYSADKVRKMIERKKKNGWEFLFIGANIDAISTAKHFGIGADRAVNYHADQKGTAVLYNCVSRAVSKARACEPMAADWSAEIQDVFDSRQGE